MPFECFVHLGTSWTIPSSQNDCFCPLRIWNSTISILARTKIDSAALMATALTCKTGDLEQTNTISKEGLALQHSHQFRPQPPPPLYLEPLHGFAQSLKMDFFAHSLLISFPADTWISWQLLIWEQFSQIGKAWALLCTNSTKICLLSHEGRRKTARLDFLKMEFNFRNFETSSDLFSQYLGISLQLKDDRLTTAPSNPADKQHQHFWGRLQPNCAPICWTIYSLICLNISRWWWCGQLRRVNITMKFKKSYIFV